MRFRDESALHSRNQLIHLIQRADPGYFEGRVAFNTAWNHSIAYSAAEVIEIIINKHQAHVGEVICIRLKAPVNIDYEKVETATIQVLDSTNSYSEQIGLAEEDQDCMYFSSTYVVPEGAGSPNSYGYGLFKKTVVLNVFSNDQQ